MHRFRWCFTLLLTLTICGLAACKGGGGLAAPAVGATGAWDVEIGTDIPTFGGGTMDFVKTGSNTFEAPWDDTWDEFTAVLTVTGSSFTLEWVSEWVQGADSHCRATTEITGTIDETTMTGSGTEVKEVVSGPDPGFDGDVTNLTFTAQRQAG